MVAPPLHTVHKFYIIISITYNLLYTAILLLPPNISLQVTPPFPSVWTPSAPEHSWHLYCFILIPVSPCTVLTTHCHCPTVTAFYICFLRQQKFLSCLTTGALFRYSVTPYHYICYFSKITFLFILPHALRPELSSLDGALPPPCTVPCHYSTRTFHAPATVPPHPVASSVLTPKALSCTVPIVLLYRHSVNEHRPDELTEQHPPPPPSSVSGVPVSLRYSSLSATWRSHLSIQS
jgi:hypothetical protein